MTNETEMQEPHGTKRMSDVAREVGQTLTDTSLNPEDHQLGAEGSETLMNPLLERQERQPRSDETSQNTPLGGREDPSVGEPDEVQGDPAEDKM